MFHQTAILILVLLLPIAGFGGGNTHKRDWVAQVNGEAITIREFHNAVLANRATVFSHFQQEFGATDGPRFWETEFQGHTPRRMLLSRALAECVSVKLQQMLARKKGLVRQISYASYLEDRRAENERRVRSLRRGQPVYGPQIYGEREYFSYRFGLLTEELQQKLAQSELASSDDELRRYLEHLPGGQSNSKDSFSGDLRGTTRRRLTEKKYKGLIAQLAASARVVINPDEYRLRRLR